MSNKSDEETPLPRGNTDSGSETSGSHDELSMTQEDLQQMNLAKSPIKRRKRRTVKRAKGQPKVSAKTATESDKSPPKMLEGTLPANLQAGKSESYVDKSVGAASLTKESEGAVGYPPDYSNLPQQEIAQMFFRDDSRRSSSYSGGASAAEASHTDLDDTSSQRHESSDSAAFSGEARPPRAHLPQRKHASSFLSECEEEARNRPDLSTSSGHASTCPSEIEAAEERTAWIDSAQNAQPCIRDENREGDGAAAGNLPLGRKPVSPRKRDCRGASGPSPVPADPCTSSSRVDSTTQSSLDSKKKTKKRKPKKFESYPEVASPMPKSSTEDSDFPISSGSEQLSSGKKDWQKPGLLSEKKDATLDSVISSDEGAELSEKQETKLETSITAECKMEYESEVTQTKSSEILKSDKPEVQSSDSTLTDPSAAKCLSASSSYTWSSSGSLKQEATVGGEITSPVQRALKKEDQTSEKVETSEHMEEAENPRQQGADSSEVEGPKTDPDESLKDE